MSDPPVHKYRPTEGVSLPDRRWPDRRIERAPLWCSVDLRDGNQALIDPMDLPRKRLLFQQLVAMGFREIEVGFPAASAIELDFVRDLVDRDRIPDDVTIQVLTQAREEQIRTTVDSLRGARRAIVHLYNSTSEVQRRVVFREDRAGVREIAVRGARLVRRLCEARPETEFVLEYSPESFTQTEPDFALEICEAVAEVWEPGPGRPLIVNLPATVEVSSPNVFADRVELFHRQLSRREHVVLSVHPHNDRGCAVAAAELAVMAGADRVEGTLLGNGERTGNVDLVTLACNLLTQGVDPGIDVSDLPAVVRCVEHCNRLPVHPRHPWAGELVFTAFSGSHQDAIRKGLAARREAKDEAPWEVPYLPVDPADVGRRYEPVIRINSQSGKGGLAHVLEEEYGLRLPRRLQIELRERVQAVADARAAELSAKDVFQVFAETYLGAGRGGGVDPGVPRLLSYESVHEEDGVRLQARVAWEGRVHGWGGRGRGPIEAFVDALERGPGIRLRVGEYHEHGVGQGADATAAAYVEVSLAGGMSRFGVGLSPDVTRACLEAVLHGLQHAGCELEGSAARARAEA